MSQEQDRLRKQFASALAPSDIGFFGTHYVAAKNFLDAELIRKINANWPQETAFGGEVPGNYILPLYEDSWSLIKDNHTAFWKKFVESDKIPFWNDFNKTVVPAIIAAVTAHMEAPLRRIFGDLFYSMEPDGPLMLMQSDVPYTGHGMHTHFYHDPGWVFTFLIYVDETDTQSFGTTLHQLKIDGVAVDEHMASVPMDDVLDACLHMTNWNDHKEKKRSFDALDIPYECGALFVFLDGPLSFHSVRPHGKNLETSPVKKRRVLRVHMQIKEEAFFKAMNQRLGGMRSKVKSGIVPAAWQRFMEWRKMTPEAFRHYMKPHHQHLRQKPSAAFDNIKKIYALNILDRLNHPRYHSDSIG